MGRWIFGASGALALVASLAVVASGFGGPSSGHDASAGQASAESAGQVAMQTRARPVTTLAGRVTRVVDGDTIHIEVRGQRTTVRLIGIDTPETVAPGKPVQCWGPQASARAKQLMRIGVNVRVVSDPTQDTRDRFGRFLGYVYTGKRSGAASVNRALVATGSGKVYVYRGKAFRYVRSFNVAESAARRAKNGLWGAPCFGNTTKPHPRPMPAPRPSNPAPAPPPSSGNCDPNYTGACVPVYPPDVNCADVRAKVRVIGTDVHKLDGDGDGWGCESYG